jgi:hypothetical protein
MKEHAEQRETTYNIVFPTFNTRFVNLSIYNLIAKEHPVKFECKTFYQDNNLVSYIMIENGFIVFGSTGTNISTY